MRRLFVAAALLVVLIAIGILTVSNVVISRSEAEFLITQELRETEGFLQAKVARQKHGWKWNHAFTTLTFALEGYRNETRQAEVSFVKSAGRWQVATAYANGRPYANLDSFGKDVLNDLREERRRELAEQTRRNAAELSANLQRGAKRLGDDVKEGIEGLFGR